MKSSVISKRIAEEQQRKAEEEFERKLKERAVELWYECCKRADVAWLYSMWTNEGYGPMRGERSYLDMIETQVELIEEFRTCKDDDETHYLVMVDRLTKAGFDLDSLFAKANAIREPYCNYEQRQKLIEEYNNDV